MKWTVTLALLAVVVALLLHSHSPHIAYPTRVDIPEKNYSYLENYVDLANRCEYIFPLADIPEGYYGPETVDRNSQGALVTGTADGSVWVLEPGAEGPVRVARTTGRPLGASWPV
jgi:strictosidine synthase-like protein